MKLSIIIPVFNEETTIRSIVASVNEVKIPHTQKEIIIVDDASTDSTREELKTISKTFTNIHIFFHKTNQGKGAAVKTALKHVTGDYIIIQDADLEYNPHDIIRLVSAVQEGNEVVFGSRLNRLPHFTKEEKNVRFFIQYIGNKFLSFITSILYGQWVTDMETCYKLFPASIAKNMKLTSHGFEFEPEITAKLIKAGLKIHEIPISTNPRGFKEGKKLQPFRDGPRALMILIKYRIQN